MNCSNNKLDDDKDVDRVNNESIKNNILLYLLLAIFFVFMPFIYPIMSKLLINFNVFSDVNDIQIHLSLYKNIYMIFVVFIISLLMCILLDKDRLILNFLKTLKFKYEKNGSSFEIGLENNYAGILQEKNINNELNATKQEIKNKLNIGDGQGSKISDIDELKLEIEQLRIDKNNIRLFAAYSITNNYVRKVLQKVYYAGKIEAEQIINELKCYYEEKIKNVSKDKIKKYAITKVDSMIDGLIYLNILEFSEDNIYIQLTNEGKDFIKLSLKES